MSGPYISTLVDADELGRLADAALSLGYWERHRQLTAWSVLVATGELVVSRCWQCKGLHALDEAFCSQPCAERYRQDNARAYQRFGGMAVAGTGR